MEASTRNVVAFISTVLCCFMQIGIVNGQGLSGLANSLGTMLLSGLDGVLDDGCKHSCPNGRRPRPRRSHSPSYNGCGSYGIRIDLGVMPPGMTRCCNTHDLCYDTCNTGRQNCDKEFKRCLNDICLRLSTKIATEECRSTVDLMHSGISMFGCQAYLDSQQNACRCGKRVKRKANDEDETVEAAQVPILPDLSHLFDDEL